MNQPQLRLKVSELRQQKGLTQEQLAERCEVSTRTIQRIESGEVDPRSYNLPCLGEALEFDFAADDTSAENVWLTLMHLSSILCLLIIPLLTWSWKKNQSYKIEQQGRQVLNFQITMTLMLFAAPFLLALFPTALIFMDEQSSEAIEAVLKDEHQFQKFLDYCEYYDLEVLPDGPGTRQRAGLIAVAEVHGTGSNG
jgi:uncharacterized Tic20 family protein